jgi:hypothetical protein
MKKLFLFFFVMAAASVFAIDNIAVPADFYDGDTTKTLVTGLTARVVVLETSIGTNAASTAVTVGGLTIRDGLAVGTNATVGGTLGVTGVATFSGNATVRGNGTVVGSSATVMMIQSTNVTMHAGTVWTQTWATVFTAVPTSVIVTPTELHAAVPFVSSVTSNGVLVTVEADKNFILTCIGAK